MYVHVLGRNINMPAEGSEIRPKDLVSWQISRDFPQSLKETYGIML
jgi:hypothetical protein